MKRSTCSREQAHERQALQADLAGAPLHDEEVGPDPLRRRALGQAGQSRVAEAFALEASLEPLARNIIGQSRLTKL